MSRRFKVVLIASRKFPSLASLGTDAMSVLALAPVLVLVVEALVVMGVVVL